MKQHSEEAIRDALNRLTQRAYGYRNTEPCFSIPRKETDADSVLYAAVEELMARRKGELIEVEK